MLRNIIHTHPHPSVNKSNRLSHREIFRIKVKYKIGYFLHENHQKQDGRRCTWVFLSSHSHNNNQQMEIGKYD